MLSLDRLLRAAGGARRRAVSARRGPGRRSRRMSKTMVVEALRRGAHHPASGVGEGPDPYRYSPGDGGAVVAVAEDGRSENIVSNDSNVSAANGIAGGQVGSQQRQTQGDAAPRRARVATGQWHARRRLAPPGDRLSPHGMQEARGSSPLSSTRYRK